MRHQDYYQFCKGDAEGVAAPLEPTPQDFYDTWHPKKSFAYRSIEEYWFEFSKAYAAAVSKNLTDKYAEMEAKWMRELLTVSEEIGELREHCISEHDCTFCGLESGKSPR